MKKSNMLTIYSTMFSYSGNNPIAKIVGGDLDGEIIYLNTEENKPCCRRCSKRCRRKPCCGGCNMCCDNEDDEIGKDFHLPDYSILQPLMNVNQRSVNYIAGPAGSGKSTYASSIIERYKKIFPEKEFFIFSRTDAKNDPALTKLGGMQVPISEKLVTDPIDIEKELTGGCVILFDDCNTIQNPKFKKAIDDLMSDIMEVGRKMDISIIITNHLVIPNERKMARTVLNEMQTLTVFPKSGSSQQISYCLKTYFGLTKKQIDHILTLPSRWVTICKMYPMFVMHEKGAYILE